MALIPPESVRRRQALKVLSRLDGELAILIRGVRALFAGETPGGHEWNQQNLKNGFLDAISLFVVATSHSTRISLRKNNVSNTHKNNYDRRLPFFEPWRRDPPPEEAAVHGTGTKSKALSGTEYA